MCIRPHSKQLFPPQGSTSTVPTEQKQIQSILIKTCPFYCLLKALLKMFCMPSTVVITNLAKPDDAV